MNGNDKLLFNAYELFWIKQWTQWIEELMAYIINRIVYKFQTYGTFYIFGI